MTQFFLAIASILAGLAVAAGAFASHGLKGSLSDVASATRGANAPWKFLRPVPAIKCTTP